MTASEAAVFSLLSKLGLDKKRLLPACFFSPPSFLTAPRSSQKSSLSVRVAGKI